MRYRAIKPLAVLGILPLIGLLLVAIGAGKAFLHRGKALPPTGSAQPAHGTPGLTGTVGPLPVKPPPPPWERLTVRDVEEALEGGDGTEDILGVLRSRLESYAQGERLPLFPPAVSLPAPQSAPLPGPLAATALDASREPTIREAQMAAIRYAEVMPEKIRRWRALSQIRNLIPRLTLGLDRDRDRTIASSTSAGKTTFTVGPEDEQFSVDFGFTWDLANLVWDSAQTSIDARSRLMVQLRQEILKETTRFYFERRRLMAEFEGNPTDDPILTRERSLRIEELTAQLDALTGGLYSSGPVN